MPLHKLPTKVITVYPHKISVNELEKRLRTFETPIVTRIFKDKILIDVRTVFRDEFEVIRNALIFALM